jgi:predicted nucleotidyltransferase
MTEKTAMWISSWSSSTASPFFDLVELQFELEEILGRKADIVTYAGLHKRIRDRVLREQVQIL